MEFLIDIFHAVFVIMAIAICVSGTILVFGATLTIIKTLFSSPP